MAKGNTYVIGDIQGCYDGLLRILDKAQFDPSKDTLYAVGDLVARGEDSLSTLRFLKSLGNSFSSVLGNHDLHFLATLNHIHKAKKSDNLDPLLNASDVKELETWLRQFPLAAKLDKHTLIVHAGLYPSWSMKKALSLSNEVSDALKGPDYVNLLKTMYGNTPVKWSKDLSQEEQRRFTVNACTRMRFVTESGELNFDNKSHPDSATNDIKPWFKLQNPKLKAKQKVIFGHWAALSGETQSPQFVGLDTGYVWGQTLTLMNHTSGELITLTA
jgi:bis(5'-nucleosyl)-tetraphosphatase (symmetrical)